MNKLKKLTEIESAYLAGFMDADGCINAQIVFRKDYQLQFQIRLSVTFFQHKRRKWLLIGMKNKIGAGTIRTRPDDMCEYALVGSEIVKNILVTLKPYIRGKKRQLTLTLLIISRLSRNQSREEFLRLCKMADHFAFLNDSKKREVTAMVVEKTWQKLDKSVNDH